MLSINQGDSRPWCAQLKAACATSGVNAQTFFTNAAEWARKKGSRVPDGNHYGDYRASPDSNPAIPCHVRRYCVEVLGLAGVADDGTDYIPEPEIKARPPESKVPPAVIAAHRKPRFVNGSSARR